MGEDKVTSVGGGSQSRCCGPPHPLFAVARIPDSAQRFERRPEFLSENHRLLPCREVAALLGMMVVDEVGIGLLCPAPRRLILLAGEDADRYWDLNALRVESNRPYTPNRTAMRTHRYLSANRA